MKQVYVALSFLLIVFESYSQDLRGKITSDNALPLPGAYLHNQKSGSHAYTDEQGHYILRQSHPGDSIKVSHVGYETQLLSITDLQRNLKLKPAAFQLNEIIVSKGINHLSTTAAIDLQTNPVNSSQELLRKVPGLFIGQHAGGGKAEQLFLRGFDLDHGTDINITVDGMPVNMVSHAHGQGYADLHFLIPETVREIDFDKGPYHANKGNFSTAGYVAFQTKERLEESSISAEVGKFNSYRALGLFNILNTNKQAAYLAADFLQTDGYFDSPQALKRFNLMGKYSLHTNDTDLLVFSASTFSSNWKASGQIPDRAVNQGLIGFFGAIDDNEGGETSRSNFSVQYNKHFEDHSALKTRAYFNRYDFELYSNFTFFLNDPVNGDQIKQKESRNILGFESVYSRNYQFNQSDLQLQAGAGLRYDDVNDIELSHTLNRSTLIDPMMLGNLNESNTYAFLNAEWRMGKLLINPALRFDYLHFDYQDLLNSDNTFDTQGQAILSPKLNFMYHQNKDLQFFLKLGKGFHSNDTRVVVAQQGREILPAAYGADLGATIKAAPRLVINAALWYLFLEQEFVYVGDEAVVEPSGKTARKGIDAGIRYQLNNWLFLNTDFTYTHARATEEAKDEQYIPLAPKFTLAGGLSIKNLNQVNAGLNLRYLASRPANEDYSIEAKGYFITDANVNYTWKPFTFGLIAENLFNTRWKETQFETTSRLQNEPESSSEIHFTPGTPFNIRASVSYRF